MNKVIVAVGSTRRPKLDGVRDALALVAPLLNSATEFEIVGVDAPSGVSATPLSRAEMMQGARNRAEHLCRLAVEKKYFWEYFLGVEGGLDVIHEGGRQWVFLENWAYVLDASGRGSFGQSGAVAVPDALARSVMEDGLELADAVDQFAGASGIRDANGAWGVLTADLVTRRDAFRVAVVNAFALFYGRRAHREPPAHHAGAS